MPKYSIIIPTYKHFEDCLRPCIEGIIKHTDFQDVEVIVVANGCGNDGTRTFVENLTASLPFKLIWEEEAVGFTRATNLGIRAAEGEYIVLMNNDNIIIGENWLNMLVAPYEREEMVGITGAAKDYHIPTKSEFLLFFLVMIKREIFTLFGELDEVFNPGYGEDIHFCNKLRQHGYKIIQVPNDVILNELRPIADHLLNFPLWHKGSVTVHDVPEWKDIVPRNERILIERWGELPKEVYIGNVLDTVSSSEIIPTIDRITSRRPKGGLIHAVIDERTNVTLSETGFLHGCFVGKDGMEKLTKTDVIPDISSFDTIKEFVLSCGSKSLAYFGGRFEGNYYIQQDADEVSSYLNDFKNLKVDNYLEIGCADGGLSRLFCDIVNVTNVYHMDIGWVPFNFPFAYRNNLVNSKNTGKIEIFRGDSHSEDADNYLKDKEFDFIFIDADHTYDSVLKDTQLAMKYAREGAIFAYHDHIAVSEIAIFYRDLCSGIIPQLTHVNSYGNKFGISVFKYSKEKVVDKQDIQSIYGNNFERVVIGKETPIGSRELSSHNWIMQNILGNKILEIGCSSGYLLRFLNGIENLDYLGIDYDQKIIEFARENFGDIGKFQVADINNFNFGQYDTIVACEIIEHLDNGKELAQKLKKHCRCLLLTCPYIEPTGGWSHHKLSNLTEKDFPGFKYDFIEINGGILSRPSTVYQNESMLMKWTKPKYSIIIPTYNHLDDCLKPCIESIIKYTDLTDTEVIVVANGCTDGTKEYLESTSFKLVWLDEKAGFSKPVNEGIKVATGDYIIILNNDTLITGSNWIDLLLTPFNDSKVGITGPVKSWYPFKSQYNFVFVAFSCAMIPRKVIDEIGLLDENLYAFGEDIDFCARAALKGYEIKPVNEGFPFIHKGAQTFIDGENSERRQLISKNLSILGPKYFDKNLPSIKMLPQISIIIPTYNHLEDCLRPCLKSIINTTDLGNVEVIIVANGCTDGTKEYLGSLGRFTTIFVDEPIGFIKATNIGIKAAKGEYIILLNNDTEIFEGTWVPILMKPFLTDNKVGITGPYKDWRFFWTDHKLAFREEYMVLYCAMIKKEVFDRVGLLDEDFGMGYEEDIDFGARVKRAGYKIVQTPTDRLDELNVTKEFLVANPNYNNLAFPVKHKDKMTFKNIKYDNTKRTSLLQKYSTHPYISIIIPTYNHLDLLKKCVESIKKYTDLSEIEVIISANGCTDDTRQYVHSLGYPFKLYWDDERVGFIRAVNNALKQSMGDYIILLNNDTELVEQEKDLWIKTLIAPFLNGEVGITGPAKAWRDDIKAQYLLFWCVAIKRKVFDKIGMLDEAFGEGYHEDVDFCIRAQKAGYKLVEVPSDIEYTDEFKGNSSRQGLFPILHKGGGTFQPIYGQSEERLKKNVHVLYNKYLPTPTLPEGWFGEGDQKFHEALMTNIPQNGTMVEIGVWRGLSLCSAAQLIKNRNITVHAIDTFQGSPWEEGRNPWVTHPFVVENMDVQKEFENNLIKFGIRDNVIVYPLPSLEAVKQFADKSIDYIFIDGDHRPDSVKADINAWLPKLKDEAIISGHDIMWKDSVAPAVFSVFGEKNTFTGSNIWYVLPQNRPQHVKPKRKVYDCFPFFNELNILEIRLNELDSVVDKFVLCEARYTHQGKPKPLYFEENKEKFSKFLHKIEHVIVDEFPSGSNWDRENYQRSYIINGLKNANPDDIIILSDADEIVSAKTVKNYNPANGVCGVEMSLFYYKLDWRLDEKWYKARIFQFSAVGKHPLQYFRGEGDYLYNTIIPNGGWHFSFMGDKNAIKQKIQAYGHAEFNNDSFTNDKNIEESIEKGRDVFKRDLHFNKVYIDHTYPDFVKDNIRYYQNENLVSKQVLTSKFLEDCIEKAWREESKIDKEVLDLMSMSNNRIRHLFNNIGSFGNLNYLEVGCWKGGSTSSMLSNNKLNTSTIIDNFSQFLPSEENKWMGEKHPREELVDNLGKFGNDNLVKIIEQDFYTVDMNTLPPADVYFYDGGHDYESQRNALKYALPALADTFIFMVDDYHWPEVNKGTKEAVEELINSGQISCLYQRELLSFTPPKDVWPDGWQKGLTNLIGEWRNGIYIGLFKKNPSQISPKNGTNKDWTGYEKVFI